MTLQVFKKNPSLIEKYINSIKIKNLFYEIIHNDGFYLYKENDYFSFVNCYFNNLTNKNDMYITLATYKSDIDIKLLLNDLEDKKIANNVDHIYIEIHNYIPFTTKKIEYEYPFSCLELAYISKEINPINTKEIETGCSIQSNDGFFTNDIINCLKISHINGLKDKSILNCSIEDFLSSVAEEYKNRDDLFSFVLIFNDEFAGHATYEEISNKEVNLIDTYILNKDLKNGYTDLINGSLKILSVMGYSKVTGTFNYDNQRSFRKIETLVQDGWNIDSILIRIK